MKTMYCNVAVCLLIIAFPAGVASTCPYRCSCPQNTRHVFCMELGLTEVPTSYPNLSENIYLFKNLITSIPLKAFEGQPEILRIHLFRNQITELQNGLFQGLPKLAELWLNYNQITTIDPGTFQWLPSVFSLYLDNNQITTIANRTFENLPALLRLQLNNNQMTTIQEGTFENLPALSEINLEGNNMSFVKADTFANITILGKLLLDLVCDCNVPFWSWLKSKSIAYEKVLCLDRNNVQLSSLQASDFDHCAPIPTTDVEPSHFSATVGDASVQIQCNVTTTTETTYCHWTFQPVDGSQQTIAQGTDDQQYTVDNSSTNPDLTIKNIALNEAGVFTCYATNAAGTSKSDPNSRHTLTVTGGKEEEDIIIYLVSGITAVLFLLVLLVVIVCYRIGQEKRKVNASYNDVFHPNRDAPIQHSTR